MKRCKFIGTLGLANVATLIVSFSNTFLVWSNTVTRLYSLAGVYICKNSDNSCLQSDLTYDEFLGSVILDMALII